MDERLRNALLRVARFYDGKKVGDSGFLGFRRSTDLSTLYACLPALIQKGILSPPEALFLDLGCGDGRVNVFFSYLVRLSLGIEKDEWTLDEYAPLKKGLEDDLEASGFPPPPPNISLFHGDSMDEKIHREIMQKTGVGLADVDLFYTYLTMDREFAGLVADRGKRGAVFMVYGLDKILPEYAGLELLSHLSPMEGALALYRKP